LPILCPCCNILAVLDASNFNQKIGSFAKGTSARAPERERERLALSIVYADTAKVFTQKKKQQREFSIVDNLFIQLFIRGTSN
jgi:hypothetical protein